MGARGSGALYCALCFLCSVRSTASLSSSPPLPSSPPSAHLTSSPLSLLFYLLLLPPPLSPSYALSALPPPPSPPLSQVAHEVALLSRHCSRAFTAEKLLASMPVQAMVRAVPKAPSAIRSPPCRAGQV